jgi:glycosyltransferase involved in cell wall biosynthesis
MLDARVSVVIPTHNRAPYILQALGSVFAQTLPPDEIVVVDDGSTDETREKLAPFIRDQQIRFISQNSSGVSAARNKGALSARCPLIAFLDSDDLFLPTKLEKQIRFFEKNPHLGFVHCWFSKFNDQGDDLGTRNTSVFSGNVYPSILQEWSVLMAMPCMLVRAEVLKQVGGFDEEMQWAEDLDLWRRIAKNYEIGLVPEPLVRVRVHSASTSFRREKGSSGFQRYLEKAFEEDPKLTWSFKQRAKAKMYAKLGQNLLGNGSLDQMNIVRKYEFQAIQTWPLELNALTSWFASFLPYALRNFIAEGFRRLRYPREILKAIISQSNEACKK